MQAEIERANEGLADANVLRLGYMDRAHLMPMVYPLKMGWVGPESPWKLEVVNATQPELLDRLLDGELDAALLSPIGVTQHGGQLATLGGWGLSSQEVSGASILLASQRLDLIEGSDIAISPQAVGSTADYLLRMLLKPYYDISFNLREPEDAGYDVKGARLLYGDEAAREAQKKPESWVAEDIGVAWWVLTGVPIVWEMLAARRDLQTRKPGAGDALSEIIGRSLRAAQEQQASVLDEASSRLGMKKSVVKEIFGRQQYALKEHEQKGLARFLDMAARAGIG